VHKGETPLTGIGIPDPLKVKVSPGSSSVAQIVNLMVSGPQKILDESGGAVKFGVWFMVIVQVAVSASEAPHLSVTV